MNAMGKKSFACSNSTNPSTSKETNPTLIITDQSNRDVNYLDMFVVSLSIKINYSFEKQQ
jgi:hypothetical protein